MDTVIEYIDEVRLENVNPLVTPTWHWMGMNEASVKIPGMKRAPQTSVEVIAPDTSCMSEVRRGEAIVSRGFETLETGMGPETAGWLLANSTKHLLVELPAGYHHEGDVIIRLNGVDGCATVLLLEIVAAEDSAIHIVMETDSPEKGSGLVGSLVRVSADSRARVQIDQVQTLDDDWIHLDDTGIHTGSEAQVSIRQTVLGGGESYVGLAADLTGYASSCKVDTRYLGSGSRSLDFNYLIRQRAPKTRGTLLADGVLTGTSAKTLRGTIDLARGCKGSVGRETETVLLVDEHVRNKTIPIILCTEDDVQGDHGATIGHIDPAQLGYLESRGLGTQAAEALFSRAMFDRAAQSVRSTSSYKAIDRLCRRTLGSGIDDDMLEV